MKSKNEVGVTSYYSHHQGLDCVLSRAHSLVAVHLPALACFGQLDLVVARGQENTPVQPPSIWPIVGKEFAAGFSIVSW